MELQWLMVCRMIICLCLFCFFFFFFFFSSRRRHTRSLCDWSSDVCSSDLPIKKWVVPMVFCLGTEGSKISLFRNGWFQCFPVQELKVPKVPYLEMGGYKVFMFRKDRKSVVQGKSVDLGGRRIIKKKKKKLKKKKKNSNKL